MLSETTGRAWQSSALRAIVWMRAWQLSSRRSARSREERARPLRDQLCTSIQHRFEEGSWDCSVGWCLCLCPKPAMRWWWPGVELRSAAPSYLFGPISSDRGQWKACTGHSEWILAILPAISHNPTSTASLHLASQRHLLKAMLTCIEGFRERGEQRIEKRKYEELETRNCNKGTAICSVQSYKCSITKHYLSPVREQAKSS